MHAPMSFSTWGMNLTLPAPGPIWPASEAAFSESWPKLHTDVASLQSLASMSTDAGRSGRAAGPHGERSTTDADYAASFPQSTSNPLQQVYPQQMVSPDLTFAIDPTKSNFPGLPSCSFDHMAQNAAVLGISPETFLSTHSASPFYQPFSTYEYRLIATQRLPDCLRPTAAQLSYPHHAWIDCVPEPDLRSRIIFSMCHRPPLLDALDLWHDVLASGDVGSHDQGEDASGWHLPRHFRERWQMLLKMDLRALRSMCVYSNPPLVQSDQSEE